MDKRISDMTVRELKSYIRKLTSSVNEKINEYKGDSTLIKSEISTLKSLGTGNMKSKKVGLGFLGKKKSELVQQARELEYFENWDIETPSGRRKIEARERRAWETFSRRNPEYSYDEWRNLVEVFGAIGKKDLDKFGSEQVRELNKEMTAEGKRTNLAKSMNEVLKESKGKGYTTDDLIDLLREKYK